MEQALPPKRTSAIFLQIVIVLIGIGALALMLWEPHLEGRNAHATVFEIYFHDPFLAYAYTASIAFFVALFQAYKLLGYVGHDRLFSLNSVKALRTIKYCAITLVTMIAGALAYLMIAIRGRDDIAGGVAMGLAMIVISSVIAAAAGLFERSLQNAMNLRA